MLRSKTMFGSGCLLIILLTGGFVLLLRSCLSKYDERSAKLPAIVVTFTENKSGSNVSAMVFSIVAFDKTTSYSSGRGLTHKTVTTTYSIQTNDIKTANKIRERKVKDHSDIKDWPLKILSHSGSPGYVWVFMGELMAFDPLTLETVADMSRLGQLNPALQNKFPKESRYYEFNRDLNLIFFTANDGIKWELNPRTLKALPVAGTLIADKYKFSLDSIEKLQAINSRLKDSVYEQYSVKPGSDYRDNKISLATYHSMQNKMVELRAKLNAEATLLQTDYLRLRNEKQYNDQLKSAISSLARIDPGFRQIGTSLDTFNTSWLGIYDKDELEELSPQIYRRRANDETARRKMVTGKIKYAKNGQSVLDLSTPMIFHGAEYLDGSLLLNKETALPFHLKNNRYLIIHKDVIGRDGKISLSATDTSGQPIWTINTGLKTWFDWQLHNGQLVIYGQNNNELMGDQANLLLIINTNTGQISQYDYYTDRD